MKIFVLASLVAGISATESLKEKELEVKEIIDHDRIEWWALRDRLD